MKIYIYNCKDNRTRAIIKNDDGSNNDEPIEQFYRRIKHHFIFISPKTDGVWEISLNDTLAKREILQLSKMYEELGIKPKEVDDISVINSLFEKASA